jgi:hypothetical protein
MWLITHPPSRRQLRGPQEARDRSGRAARRSLPTLIGSRSNDSWTAETDPCAGLTSAGRPASPANLNGLPTVPHVSAHSVADWAVALIPPAVQGVDGYAQHFRDIRERHQLVSGLECHDHLPFVDRSRVAFGAAESAWRPGRSRRGLRASGSVGHPSGRRLATVIDLSREATAGGRRATTRSEFASPAWKTKLATLG